MYTYYVVRKLVSQVVPVRLDSETLELIEMLVRLGVFRSRSEALRELISSSLEGFRWVSEVAGAVEKLFELEKREGDIPVRLDGALEQLLEGRGRF